MGVAGSLLDRHDHAPHHRLVSLAPIAFLYLEQHPVLGQGGYRFDVRAA